MARKSSVTSHSSAVEIMRASLKPIQPPANCPLDAIDLRFFKNVLEEFARSEWTAHQLEIAATMARCMNDLNREQQELRHEGFIAARANGTTVENPRQRVVKALTTDLLSLRRSLSLHARARGEARDISKRTKIAQSIERNNPVDDLLAKPAPCLAV
jgi:phage terminase small subunit